MFFMMVALAKVFGETFTLLLYDVTTLYFETHKPDDDLQEKSKLSFNLSFNEMLSLCLILISTY
jgi:hypothetical protein